MSGVNAGVLGVRSESFVACVVEDRLKMDGCAGACGIGCEVGSGSCCVVGCGVGCVVGCLVGCVAGCGVGY